MRVCTAGGWGVPLLWMLVLVCSRGGLKENPGFEVLVALLLVCTMVKTGQVSSQMFRVSRAGHQALKPKPV